MRHTRRKRSALKTTQQAKGVANKSRTAELTAASSVALSASPSLKNEKMERTHSEEEYIMDDIELDVYKIQPQRLSQKVEIAPTLTSASTSAAVVHRKAVTVQKAEGDKHGSDGISVSLRDCGQNIEKTKSNTGDDVQSIHSEFNFDVDELDLQETDSDGDGYSDVNFEEEFELIECDGDIDVYAPEWSKYLNTQRRVFINKNYSGFLKVSLKSSFPTYYFYKLLGGLRFFKFWSKCCNERARHSSSILEEFTPTEMSIFYGICMQMGSLQLTTLAEYWDSEAYHGFEGFSGKMNLNRFLQILKFLNFDGFLPEGKNFTTDDPSERKFVDLKPLLHFFNERMESTYNCGQNIVLNEPILYWKGRLRWASDVIEKFRTNAVMLHLLTEKSGLVLKILADLEDPQRTKLASNSKSFVIQRMSIAMELLSEKFHKGYTVFASKYYGSYALCFELGNLGTYSSGFLEIQRFGNSKDLALQDLKQYQCETRYAQFVMMGKSRRREKNLYFYSSDCLVATKIKTRAQNDIQLVKDIERHLKTDADIRSYMLDYQLALNGPELKWDKRLMIYVMHLIVFNAYLLFTTHARSGTSLMSYQNFRQEVITSLLNARLDWFSADENDSELNLAVNGFRGFPDESPTPKPSKVIVHLPVQVPNFNGQRIRKRCRICDKGGLVTFSKTCCRICPEMPGLCATPCFDIWHAQIRSASGYN